MCLPGYEHGASTALIRDYGVIAPVAMTNPFAMPGTGPIRWARVPGRS
jgi:hypothetical protein